MSGAISCFGDLLICNLMLITISIVNDFLKLKEAAVFAKTTKISALNYRHLAEAWNRLSKTKSLTSYVLDTSLKIAHLF